MRKGRRYEKNIGIICQEASIQPKWGLLLYVLVKEFKPSQILELGTSLGLSAAYQAAALETNHKGHLFTLEGAEAIANKAEMSLEQLGYSNLVSVIKGNFLDTLDSVLIEMKNLDFSLIDGHHDKKATLQYFEKIMPFLEDDAVMIFDDISWSKGMREAWDEIRRSSIVSSSFKVISFLHSWGIIIIDKKRTSKQLHFITTF